MRSNALGRFTDRADDYVAGRPSYPDASIALLFEDLGDPALVRVVDLGAGTGISARLLTARGATVIAVEPNAAMRGGAARAERVTWTSGTAEDTGLPAASADLVTAFQAFHWFDAPAALAEIARILRPGGRAAIVYNERDPRDPFTADYGELVRRYATDRTEARRGDGRETFAAFDGWQTVTTTGIANAQVLDRAGVHARARSTSYLPNRGLGADELHAAIDASFDRYARDGSVTMHLKTIVTIGSASR